MDGLAERLVAELERLGTRSLDRAEADAADGAGRGRKPGHEHDHGGGVETELDVGSEARVESVELSGRKIGHNHGVVQGRDRLRKPGRRPAT